MVSEISQKQRKELADNGMIAGERRKLTKSVIKSTPAPAPVPEVHNHESVNNIHMDLEPLRQSNLDTQKVIRENSKMIKALAAQLKAMTTPDDRKIVFRVKRDSNGFIEEIIAEKE